MIVYDKEQKEIVIPNGIGNIDIYNNGVEAGYNQGYEQGQAVMAANARVLNVTENGTYLSKYSGPIISTTYAVTGVYDDGTEFYDYAELNGKVFNTKIAGSIKSRLEFWYKGDNTLAGYVNNVIIGSGDTDKDNSFQVKYFDNHNNGIIRVRVGINFGDIYEWDNTVWHHLIISKPEGGVWIDGMHKFYFVYDGTIDGEFFINGIGYDVNSNANGYFGMIKIDDTIIIPTADGFKNVNTGELLEVVKDGGYTFTESVGGLYKTINVNVPDLNGSYDEGYAQGKIDGVNEQKGKLESINITDNGVYSKEDGYNHIEVNVISKINVQKTGLRLGYSTFTEVPEFFDFEGITDMSNMFNGCSNLQTMPLIDTSNVTNMSNMFTGCFSIRTIPLIDTSNVTNMDSMFRICDNLIALPELDVSKVTNISNYFRLSKCDKLTNVGGWKNLKINWNDRYGLAICPNLTYQSCINILNGLYDFVGNGSTETRTLKVHPNFLTTVGDEISIGVAKGWNISA